MPQRSAAAGGPHGATTRPRLKSTNRTETVAGRFDLLLPGDLEYTRSGHVIGESVQSRRSEPHERGIRIRAGASDTIDTSGRRKCMRVDTPSGGLAFKWLPPAPAFPLDSFGRVTRSFGGSPRQVPAQQHTRVHDCVIGADPIKNHFASRDLPPRPLPNPDYGPGVSTSRSDKTRIDGRCHNLSVTRRSVFVESCRALRAGAVGKTAHDGEAHGSGGSGC